MGYDRLSSRITYLMEPLKVLEIDAGGGEVQLRSQNPTARNDERGYYEMRLFRQGMLRMERFTFDEATRQRRPLAASSRARFSSAWPTTSSPAWSEQTTCKASTRSAFVDHRGCTRGLTAMPWRTASKRKRAAWRATNRRPIPVWFLICSKRSGARRRCSPPCHWASSTLSKPVPSRYPLWPESLKLDAGRPRTSARRVRGTAVAQSTGSALRKHAGGVSAYLCKQSPRRLTGYLNYSNEILWKMWGNLEDAVREGTNRWQQTFGWDGPIFSNFFQHRRIDARVSDGHARAWTHQLAARGRRVRPEPVSSLDRPGWGDRTSCHRRLRALSPACEPWCSTCRKQGLWPARLSVARRVADRIEIVSGDFFVDRLPEGDLYWRGANSARLDGSQSPCSAAANLRPAARRAEAC